MSATPEPQAPRRGRRLVVVGTVLALLAGGGVLAWFTLRDDTPAAASITLQPADSSGPDPFTASVVIGRPPSLSERAVAASEATRAKLATDPATGNRVAPGATEGLYGGSGDDRVCDADQLVGFLDGHADKAAAWAAVAAIRPDGIESFVAKLTPVLLTGDTFVTDHGFRGGVAVAVPSVLEAGTAVLVDPTGMPRVRCNSGNPLTAPEAVSIATATTTGRRWTGFSPASVTVVQAGPTVTTFVVIDVTTAATTRVPVASSRSTKPPRTSTTRPSRTETTAGTRSATVAGVYAITAGTAGSVSVHVSLDHVTVAVKAPFKLQGATCELPASTVLATFEGKAPRLSGRYSGFDTASCTHRGSYGTTLDVNDDGSLTIGLGASYLLTKTADGSAVASPKPGGEYSVTVGTEGSVNVSSSGDRVTVSVATPFRLQDATCELPTSTVLATFEGTLPHLSGRYSGFDPTTCAHGGSYGTTLDVNDDDSLTIGLGASYLLVKR